jgi:hypothetical protein
VEKDYTCVGGTSTSSSACSYSGPIAIQVLSVIKNPFANTVYLEAIIQPALPELGTLDFNQVFTPSFAVTASNCSYDPSTGTIRMNFSYDSSLNAQELSVDFTPPATPEFFYMPVSSASLPETSTNNLALKAYPSEVYDLAAKEDYVVWTLAALALGLLLLCLLFGSKLMGIEMIFVFQATYGGLLVVTKMEALLVPLRHLSVTSFYSGLLPDSAGSSLPQRLS